MNLFLSLGKQRHSTTRQPTIPTTTLAALLLATPSTTLLVRAFSISHNNNNINTMRNLPPTNQNPSNKKYTAVLFDMDGTLLDTEPLGCRAVYLTMNDWMSEQARADFQDREYRMEWALKQQTLGLPDRQWPPIVLEWATHHWGVSPNTVPSVDEFLQAWDQHMFDNMSTVGLMPGAAQVVEQLHHARIPMAIATSSRKAAVQEKRQRHEDTIFQKIATIVTTDDPAVVHGKPAPDIYIEAARRLGIAPDDDTTTTKLAECIVVEDGMTGVLAGKAAGCFVIAIPDARSTEEERAQFAQTADLVFENLEQWNLNEFFPSVEASKATASTKAAEHE